MQSEMRRFNRINSGLQNPAPSSTKISSHTKGESIGLNGYRKGRFHLPVLGGLPKFINNRSFKSWIEKYVIQPKARFQEHLSLFQRIRAIVKA